MDYLTVQNWHKKNPNVIAENIATGECVTPGSVAYNSCEFCDRESRILLYLLPEMTASQVTLKINIFFLFCNHIL